jgi:hypothetical protein
MARGLFSGTPGIRIELRVSKCGRCNPPSARRNGATPRWPFLLRAKMKRSLTKLCLSLTGSERSLTKIEHSLPPIHATLLPMNAILPPICAFLTTINPSLTRIDPTLPDRWQSLSPIN